MYREYHDHFDNEVYQAVGSYVIWKNLQNEPARDEKLLKALNKSPTSWIFLRHSMMLSLIMSLGRIFDTDGDAVSVDDLIKSCINELHLFSKESVHNRNQKLNFESLHEPNEKDFQRLKPEIKKHRNIYELYYKPLRHKIFAHSDKEFHARTDELWEATKNANIENVLNFLSGLNICIRSAYLNGHKLELRDHTFNEHWFERDIKSLLTIVRNA